MSFEPPATTIRSTEVPGPELDHHMQPDPCFDVGSHEMPRSGDAIWPRLQYHEPERLSWCSVKYPDTPCMPPYAYIGVVWGVNNIFHTWSVWDM